MNCSYYIFAYNEGSFIQYPDDNTKEIFKSGIQLCTGDKQLIIHRDEQLMYYCFMQRLDNKIPSYVGICVMLNDILFTDIQQIYNLLDQTITNFVISGKILDFSKNGIRLRDKNFSKKSVEIIRTFHELMKYMNLMEGSICKLPPINYSIERNSYYQCKLSNKHILRLSLDYGYLMVCSESTEEKPSEVVSLLKPLQDNTSANSIFEYIGNLNNKDKCIFFLIALIALLTTILIIK